MTQVFADPRPPSDKHKKSYKINTASTFFYQRTLYKHSTAAVQLYSDGPFYIIVVRSWYHSNGVVSYVVADMCCCPIRGVLQAALLRLSFRLI